MSACPCSLEATADRLHHPLTPEERELLRALEFVDPNEPAFEAHMRFEEDVIAKAMKAGDRWTLRAHHAVIRSYRDQGIPVNKVFFAQHVAWEQRIFPTLGHRSQAPHPH